MTSAALSRLLRPFSKKSSAGEICEGCAVGKATRYSFPKVGSKKSAEILQLVHSDVCGPLSVPSVGGSIYFVTFIDDYSNYVWVNMLKKKSEALEKFIEFVAMAENSSGKTLKKLRMDNGGEYISNEFSKFVSNEEFWLSLQFLTLLNKMERQNA